jgi:hypothetical protein
MRLVKRNIDRDGSGSVTLYPEEPEDMVRQAPLQQPLKPPTYHRESGMLTTSFDLQTC